MLGKREFGRTNDYLKATELVPRPLQPVSTALPSEGIYEDRMDGLQLFGISWGCDGPWRRKKSSSRQEMLEERFRRVAWLA